MSDPLLIAICGESSISSGPISDVLTDLKARHDRGEPDSLIFDQRTGAQVDFDLRGSLAEVLDRAVPSPPPRGRGRPRLGVTGREVSLLPKHWDWLEAQPSGASAALRKLVEQATRADPGREQARRLRAALCRVLSALAGDREHYEEAIRALFGGEDERFAALTAGWPRDIRDYAVRQAREASRQERQQTTEDSPDVVLVRELYDRVWSRGEYDAIDRLIAPRYTIHSDPGEPWEGRTLDHAEYLARVRYSRRAFPDLHFTIDAVVAAGSMVSVRWHAEGTQLGDLAGVPATGKRSGFAGQTMYEIADGRVHGHWQVVDRLGFYQQLRG